MAVDLTRITAVEVPMLWEQRTQLFGQNELDLAKTEAVDSAGIAFLVQWAKAQPQKQLKLSHVSTSVKALIKTFRLEPLFVLAE